MRRFKLWTFNLILIFCSVCLYSSVFAQIPAPPLVPLDDAEKLGEVSYNTDGTGYFICNTEQGLADCEFQGKQWAFKSIWDDLEKGTIDLTAWLTANEITITVGKESKIYAHKQMSENSELYFRFDLKDTGYSCNIVEKITLRQGEKIKVIVSPDYPNAVFYTVHDGKSLDRLDIDVTKFAQNDPSDPGDSDDPDHYLEIDFDMETRVIHGKLNRNIQYSTSRLSLEGLYWEIQGIPQFPGIYRCNLSLRSGDDPPEIEVSLKKGMPIPNLKPGDALGGLLVKNVPYGAATAIPEYDDQNTYPGFDGQTMVGDVTPSGEALFWLPPGMWAIHVNPKSDSDSASLLKSHFIPVYPGKMTYVEWPKSLNDAFAMGEKGRMKILSETADETTASIDIAMLGTDRTTVIPALDNIQVAESGQPSKLISVERINTPADIILLLDSSGSMKGQMKPALNATRQFIESLPGNTKIELIDFDTQPKPIKGNSPKEALAALKTIKANGATALYDSILLGLSKLKKADRPSLLVFTDGVDANWDDSGPGSVATQDEVIEAVSKAGIPVFTIGFGENSDVNTLSRIADMSGGEYYVAPDEESLARVFAQINSNLGSQFKIEYERPKTAGASNRPVMSIMVDNSGSMDSWPEVCSGCDKRMERTRQILRQFIEALPDDFLIQVATFSGDVIVEQVLTANKEAALRGIAQMEGRTTTNILASLATSLKTLKSVPSNRRYLVYLADAALDVDDDEKEVFEATLGKIKDSNISTLFIGMVGEEDKAAFEHAAQRTNGTYVVSKDFDTLSQTFNELSKTILGTAKENNKIIIRAVMTHRKKDGENQIFSSAKEVTFPLKPKTDEIAEPEEVVWEEQGPLTPYDSDLSGLISGTDIMMKDVRVTKRLPLDLTVKNEAVAIRLSEALSLSRFRGIEAPDNLRFFALTMELENILPSQKVAIYPDGSNHPAAWVAGGDEPLRYEEQVPTYLIPDIRKHFFLRWNNNRSYPVSEVTWLAQEPLTMPGDEALAIEDEKKITGTLMFMAPSDHMLQSSLHLYDTNYGHIDIPISGILKTTIKDIEALPEKEPKKLSDTFSFKVTNIEKTDIIEKSETEDDTSYVIIDGEFRSRMQAHLDLDPKERFKLKVPCDEGNIFLSLHPATTLLPLGFFRPALVTPGAQNPVRMVFNVPRALLENLEQASILIDLNKGGVEIPLYDNSKKADILSDPDAKGQGVSLKIVRSGPLDPDTDVRIGDNLFAVEALIQDEKDNIHTQIGELIVLRNKDFDPEKAAQTEKELERLRREAATLPTRGLGNFGQSTLKVIPGMLAPIATEYFIIGGLDEDSIVPDGETVKGVFLFELPEGSLGKEWEISSLIIPDMSIKSSEEDYDNEALFAKRRDIESEVGSYFQEELEDKLLEIMAQREAEGFEKQGSVVSRSVEPGATEEKGQRVPPIALTTSGKKDFVSIKTMDQLRKRLETIRFLQSGSYTSWIRQYQPEAVLTQNWGSENDLIYMVEHVLAREGFVTVRTEVELTDSGRQKLAKLANLDDCSLEVLPAVKYMDHEGKDHTIVAPFLTEATQLKDFIIQKPGFIVTENNNEKLDIIIELLLEPTGNAPQQQMMDIVDALGGGSEGLYKMGVFQEGFEMVDLSSGAVDIGYTKIPVNGAVAYQAVVDTPVGRMRSEPDYCVSTKDFEVVGEIITLRSSEHTFTRRRMLKKKEKITGIFHTIGINLPDLIHDNADSLASMAKEKKEALTGNPNAISALKWYNRGVMGRFISAQTAYEKELAEQLNLTIGRLKNFRCIMVNVAKAEDETPLSISMDLVYPHNTVHRAPDEMAIRAFNIMSGMANARFEAAALGKEGIGLFDIWKNSQADTSLLAVDDDNVSDFISQLEEKEYPSHIIDYFKNLEYDKLVLFPTSPAEINSESRWAWLEFNKETYQVVSVLDTGEHGSLVEKVVGNPVEQAGQYMVGVLVGIDTSLWAVAAFSLEMDDYSKILKAAKKFVKGMGDNFGVGGKLGKAAMGIDVGGAPAAGYGRYGKVEITPGGLNPTNNLGGFGNGYADGVDYYFSKAK